MGCFASSPADAADSKAPRKPPPFGPPAPWAHPKPMPQSELDRLREEFWGTTGTGCYGGQPEIWNALHAAVDADIDTARLICDAAGVVVPGRDLSAAYDERGALYELPPYVLSAPTNLFADA